MLSWRASRAQFSAARSGWKMFQVHMSPLISQDVRTPYFHIKDRVIWIRKPFSKAALQKDTAKFALNCSTDVYFSISLGVHCSARILYRQIMKRYELGLFQCLCVTRWYSWHGSQCFRNNSFLFTAFEAAVVSQELYTQKIYPMILWYTVLDYNTIEDQSAHTYNIERMLLPNSFCSIVNVWLPSKPSTVF